MKTIAPPLTSIFPKAVSRPQPSLISPQTITASAQPHPAAKAWLAVYADLFKARLTFLVLLTTFIGFYMGFQGPVNCVLMLHTLLGTALVAGCASALNQLWERNFDAKMR